MKILEYCHEKKIAFSEKPKILFLLFTSLFTNAVKTAETVFFILWKISINLRPIENLILFILVPGARRFLVTW